MIIIVSVLVALCFICVVSRIAARLRRTRMGFGVDDYLSMVSMVLMLAMLIELVLCKFKWENAHCAQKILIPESRQHPFTPISTDLPNMTNTMQGAR